MAMPREQKVAVKNLFEMHLFEAVIRQVTKRLNCAGQFLQDTESISLQEPITSRFIFVDGAVSVRCNVRAWHPNSVTLVLIRLFSRRTLRFHLHRLPCFGSLRSSSTARLAWRIDGSLAAKAATARRQTVPPIIKVPGVPSQ